MSAPSRCGILAVLAAVFCSSPATAAPIDRELAERIARLDRDVERAASIRQVKRLQTAYAHFADYGMWDAMADLFAAAGVLRIGDAEVKGRKAIRAWLIREFGGGRLGLAPGDVATRLQLTPVINLSADGHTAKGRWHELAMLGRLGGAARWSGGISENDYVLEGGRWKIARLHLYPMYAGSYDEGWKAPGPDIKPVPLHFTPDTAGVPVPKSSEKLRADRLPQDAEAATARIGVLRETLARMTAEDAAERLQNIYGYYVDQKMWTDVTDLFAKDGTFEIVGTGRYSGEQSIRRAFGSMASNGLVNGEVNDHLQLEPLVTVAPGGREAWLRGFQLGMLGQNGVGAWWTQAIVETHVARGSDGLWRIRSMRVFPKLRSDYYQGWARSQVPEPRPARGYEPDAPGPTLPAASHAWIPAFNFPHPATGKPIVYPADVTAVGANDAALAAANTPLAGARDEAPPTAAILTELARQLAVAKAHDSVANVSHAFGDYLDDFDWDNSSALFARTGRRGKYQVGFYVGPERIRTAETTQYGRPRSPRTSVQIHLRTQPVIDVSNDGMTAKLRTRLFSFSASTTTPGSFQGAMYPNDKLVMQEGVWKFQHQSIDEFYSRSAGYQNGWAKVPEVDQARQFAPDRTPSLMDRLRAAYPPDVDILDMGLRGVGFAPNLEFVDFPDVKPMWFHYANPVSGRLPPNYCPDHSTCYQAQPLFQDQEPTPGD
jgi:hypothetical protein